LPTVEFKKMESVEKTEYYQQLVKEIFRIICGMIQLNSCNCCVSPNRSVGNCMRIRLVEVLYPDLKISS
jgi:hypothetical protein